MRTLAVLFLAFTASAFAQPWGRDRTLSGPVPACVGAPGNTIGPLRSVCSTIAGALYACKNAAGCTVAADWQAQGGGTGHSTVG